MYGHVDIGPVYSSVQVGGFAFFGGKEHSLVAINIRERRLCKDQIKSVFSNTYSLRVCYGSDQKVCLSLGGEDPEYSSGDSDFLDVTKVYHMQKMDTDQYTTKANRMLDAPKRKDQTFNFDDQKVKQLDLYSPREEILNKVTSNNKGFTKESISTIQQNNNALQKEKDQSSSYTKTFKKHEHQEDSLLEKRDKQLKNDLSVPKSKNKRIKKGNLGDQTSW